MRRETTPPAITPAIIDFCKELSDATPVYISVHPAPEMKINDCFRNVSKLVEQVGGKQVNGWVIWQFANVFLNSEAHAIWQSDVGTLIDPTPHADGETKILFLPDSKVEYRDRKIPGKKKALTDSPLTKEYVALAEEMENYLVNTISRYNMMPGSPVDAHIVYAHKRCSELLSLFRAKAGRNEPCPCGSGLKYKKCCGQFD